ncbi:Arm DNA-binding domain-containing protein [Sphingobium sp.]|uniref:Arm DNA-binding domain-containing protein n=1 Tax=Sphingobium sp. TaxID=1912891 RepID=UPI00257AB17F|nr:Arm DNA-binding domain-containing protein [Sphingobium sp.]
MVLTDTAIRNAKPADKPYKVTDSQGLYLLVNPRGSKLWRIKYRIDGVERKLSLGAYPEITLAEARAARDVKRRSKGTPDRRRRGTPFSDNMMLVC